MYLEQARDLWQGILLLGFVVIATWVDLSLGLGLLMFVGVMKLQESVTDWCPIDLVLKPLGMKKRSAT